MSRRHDIDALRVFAFALLILYHIAMTYVGGWDWHVKSTYLAPWLQLPLLMINRWRMSLLFLISGAVIGIVRAEAAPGKFIASRSLRLLLPLVFGVLTMVPIQNYCEDVSHGVVPPGLGNYLHAYLDAFNTPHQPGEGWTFGITWNHLWYLAYVWAYTVVLMLCVPLGRTALAKGLADRFRGLRGAALLIVPALPMVIYLWSLAPFFPATRDFIDDLYQHAQFFTAFLIGYLIARADGIWTEIARLRKTSLLITVILGVPYAFSLMSAPDPLPLWLDGLFRAIRGFYVWSMLLTILGFGYVHLNRPFRWLPYATEAVFPWYILHQTVLIVWMYWLAPRQVGPTLEPLLIFIGVVAGCTALHEIIRRVPPLRPLFGMKWMSTAVKQKPSDAAVTEPV